MRSAWTTTWVFISLVIMTLAMIFALQTLNHRQEVDRMDVRVRGYFSEI